MTEFPIFQTIAFFILFITAELMIIGFIFSWCMVFKMYRQVKYAQKVQQLWDASCAARKLDSKMN